MDLGTSGGQWLFKDRDLLMGPVSAQAIIEKLGKGEISPETTVADEDLGDWTQLKEVPFFKVHVARAQARSRVLRDKSDGEASRRRSARRRTLILISSALALVIAVGTGAYIWVTSSRIGESSAELAEVGITISPPVIALASRSRHLGESEGRSGAGFLDVDLPDGFGTEPGRAGSRAKPSRVGHISRKAGRAGSKHGTAKATGAAPSKQTARADADGLATSANYDMAQIQSVLKRRSSTLFPCIRAEVKRTAFRGAIPFEFVVTNAGRVGKIWIDNKILRGTPLEACFQKTMATWRFKSFSGERPTVSQSFNIGD